LMVMPVNQTIRHAGYQAAFLWFGLGQGAVVLLAALVLRAPRPGEVPAAPGSQGTRGRREYTPVEVLRAPAFLLLFAMLTMVAAPGLLMVAQLGVWAADFGVADTPVSLLGVTLVALEFASALALVLNGVARPFFGWVSDHIGRERTMFIAFALGGGAI